MENSENVENKCYKIQDLKHEEFLRKTFVFAAPCSGQKTVKTPWNLHWNGRSAILKRRITNRKFPSGSPYYSNFQEYPGKKAQINAW